MLIHQLISRGRQLLRGGTEAEILLAFVVKKPREFLIAHPEAKVTAAACKRFDYLCKKRASGVPLNYLTHRRAFYGLDFYVDSRVLIPRPETELLVEEVLDFCEKGKKLFKKEHGVHLGFYAMRFHDSERARLKSGFTSVLDVGTGSGCIAISLAVNLPEAKITAVDISKEALCVARKNAKIHGVFGKIVFLQSDLIDKISGGKFDCIVANLPYISQKEKAFLESEVVDYEPKLALFGGKKGTELFAKLFGQIREMKFKPKILIGEIGFFQKKEISKLIKTHFGEFSHKVEWAKDLAGLNRMFTIRFHN